MSKFEWVDDPVTLAARDDIDVVVELIGGSDGPALALARATLESGKALVTANKAMLAHHGIELARMAEAQGAALKYEAAVAGGIPVIKGLREGAARSEEHTSELQSLMRISYAVFCLKKKKKQKQEHNKEEREQ